MQHSPDTSQIQTYREKWWRIAFSKKPVDRAKATAGINAAYAMLGKSAPAIRFFDSPQQAVRRYTGQSPSQTIFELGELIADLHFAGSGYIQWIVQLMQSDQEELAQLSILADLELPLDAAANQIQAPLLNYLRQLEGGSELFTAFNSKWISRLATTAGQTLWQTNQQSVREEWLKQPWGALLSHAEAAVQPLVQPLSKPLDGLKQQAANAVWQLIDGLPIVQDLKQSAAQLWTNFNRLAPLSFANLPIACNNHVPAIDFAISVMQLDAGIENWQAYQLLTQECCWVYAFEKTCFVIERPVKVCWDAQKRLHAEGKPALLFADDTCVYAYQGAVLPERYGKVSPHRWQADWILAEKNAELRRILIQGIGYERLCQELRAQTLDTWREYVLLKIDLPQQAQVDGRDVIEEPIHLLKMTCPSTQQIHVLRVPPTIYSAQEAIRWVNWDVDPTDFAAQT